jgi:Flp pilus assembly protein TadD
MPTDLLKLQRTPREVARWQKAQQQVLGNRHAPALASYRELVHHFPGVAQLWFELGIAAAGALELGLAAEALARAETLATADVSLLVLLGQQYHRLRRLDRARACFERAAAVDPSSVHARLSLAAWYERERRLEEAWSCVEACLAQHPHNAQVLCVRALLLHRQGKNAEAEALLRDLIRRDSPDPNVRYSSRQLLGVVLDELGQYAEAMRWLGEAKAQARRMADTARMERDYDEADRRRRVLLASLTPAMIQRWGREAPGMPGGCQLTLLGGHPRSGTTLLEQILGAHPGILAFDEPEGFVQEVWNQLAPMPPAPALTAKALDGLDAGRVAELRRRYFKSLLREAPGEPAGQILLDKNPSPTTALHLWLRVFPELKVIIALRDPRDVVVSSFFQNLMLTPTNANFLSLERTATHYANLMDVWLRLRELGGFDWIETRYEDTVASLEPDRSNQQPYGRRRGQH